MKKILKPILLQSIAGIVTAVSIFIGSFIYGRIEVRNLENQRLSGLYLSVSKEYINELFGIPFVSIKDLNGLSNDFYFLNNGVLRVVSDDGLVVAYFITIDKQGDTIRVLSPDGMNSVVLGKATYHSISPELDYGTSIVTEALYKRSSVLYCEKYNGWRGTDFNPYYYAVFDYGFFNENWDLFFDLWKQLKDESGESVDYDKLLNERKSLKPNTFGTIDPEYEDKVKIDIDFDQWPNISRIIENRKVLSRR